MVWYNWSVIGQSATANPQLIEFQTPLLRLAVD